MYKVLMRTYCVIRALPLMQQYRSAIKLAPAANYSHQTKSQDTSPQECYAYKHFSNAFGSENTQARLDVMQSMTVYNDFISASEEQNILNEIEPYLSKMHYERDHWDDAIHGYRETERLKWNDQNSKIIDRVCQLAFRKGTEPIKFVHILDLDKDGYIKPHIDAVRFCGDTIAGMSLLTDSVMRLVHDKQRHLVVDVLLKRRSLYVMTGTARYDYTHEILSNKCSQFKGETVEKSRRISVICRNAPLPDEDD